MGVTPSLPQRGRQHKGSVPLTPFSEEFSLFFCGAIPIVGDAQAAGAAASDAVTPKSGL